jgi:hypothetical protein
MAVRLAARTRPWIETSCTYLSMAGEASSKEEAMERDILLLPVHGDEASRKDNNMK